MLHLDEPTPQVIITPYLIIRGWSEFLSNGHQFRFLVNDTVADWKAEERPDVENYLGFILYVDLTSIVRLIDCQTLIVKVIDICCQKYESSNAIPIAEDCKVSVELEFQNRVRRRLFVKENLKCEKIVNQDTFGRLLDENAVNLCDKTDGTSLNGYGEPLHQFLSKFPKEAVILEAGSGFRIDPVQSPLIVNQELFLYPSTDLACDLHAVPLRDSIFDGAVISAVFEHVKNPFVVAQELCRLVKPGGLIYVDVPFLQAEHGYPHHYFNMTRAGVSEIFSNIAKLEKQNVIGVNQTKNSIRQILNLYLDSARKIDPKNLELLSNMKVRDFLEKIEDIVLEEEDDFRTAWGTTSIFEVI